MELPPSRTVRRHGEWTDAHDRCVLSYEKRFLRRRVLETARDDRFLVDLEHTTSLDHGDAFELEDGRRIEVIAAEEELLEVTGDNLVHLAWHIGNRHAPCQIEETRLLIQRDHVMRDMLGKLGAAVRDVVEPFSPAKGAYGHARTHGHAH